MDIEGVHTTSDFEVIDIFDDSKPYPPFLGIDLAFDNMHIINLKKIKMIFEGNNMRVIVPLGTSERVICTKLVKEGYFSPDIYNIY